MGENKGAVCDRCYDGLPADHWLQAFAIAFRRALQKSGVMEQLVIGAGGDGKRASRIGAKGKT